MIENRGKVFALHTQNTTYLFRISEHGHPEHLYYGRRLKEYDPTALALKNEITLGSTVEYTPDAPNYSLDTILLEYSGIGKGDYRHAPLELLMPDGTFVTDFVYQSHEIKKGAFEAKSELPFAFGESETLLLVLRDKKFEDITLTLHYTVFEDSDVITRGATLKNDNTQPLYIRKLMSFMLDLPSSEYEMTTLDGSWAKEAHMHTNPLTHGIFVNDSTVGASSNRHNPAFLLKAKSAGEEYGEVYGFNLIYSGNHYEAAETNAFGKMRLVTGINPRSFQFHLAPGDFFEAPEAVMTCSCDGYNGMSQNMHSFVRNCIVRGVWKKKARPVLLNSWEASYFNINEHKLLGLAKAGKEAGIELFVMDDGWFGTRDDDTQALGDWFHNPKKLPGGVAGLAKKINDLGLDFGIWVEPEMINTNSDLYRAHPEWVMEIPGKPHSESRNQRILDFANPEVVEYMTAKMVEVFSSGNVAYVKWDMNRIFSDYYSLYLPAARQKEVAHRYMMGLYRMLESLNQQFPDILFEGCASGGNRFDLGMLCYFPQIWASDDSDAIYRVEAQTGYSYGYPMSTVTAHVSDCPNHQTLRVTPLPTRFHVAAFGVLGYECHLAEMSRDEIKEIKDQIVLYKQWRDVLQYGTFYRGRSGDNIYEWTCVSPDKKRAVGMVLQVLVNPNTSFETYRPMGLNAETKYHFTNRQLEFNLKEFGSLINHIAPIHIKKDSLVHNAASAFIKMKGEKEDCIATGEMLMNGSVKLKQGFAATGYADDIRFFKDFASRMYFMEALE